MTEATAPYHHGDLKNAVRTAALDIIATSGPSAFTLSEVARRAGVSHTAPSHHFGDKRRLLTTLATEGFQLLADEMIRAAREAETPRQSLIDQVGAYVALHREHPGYSGVMWRLDLVDATDPDLSSAAHQAFRLLHRATSALDPGERPQLTDYQLTLLIWSLAHGLSQLGDRFTPALRALVDDPVPGEAGEAAATAEATEAEHPTDLPTVLIEAILPGWTERGSDSTS